MTHMNDNTVPRCMGVIIDGNRRWARANGKSSLEGHEAGYKKAKDFVLWCRDRGIQHVVVYAFSSENWKRAPEEVSYLMKLLEKLLQDAIDDLKKEGVRVSVIGDRDRLSPSIRRLIEKAEEETKQLDRVHAAFAISYGGRDEILHAVNSIIAEKKQDASPHVSITKEMFETYLWTSGMPDPDIIIRTSGEMRLSNFLSWQSAYSELFFLSKHWPDIKEEDLDEVLRDFANRQRRFGV